jgi:NADH-quinone oxidoreductase subunit H
MPTFYLIWTVLVIAVVMGVILNTVNYLILLERKISAYMQNRIGPNRVGPYGLLQPFVDGIKMFFKEDIIPKHVNVVFYLLAPAIATGTALLAFSVVPFGPSTAVPPPAASAEAFVQPTNTIPNLAIAPNIDIGILFVFAIGSLAVYGIVLGGWSSNNKYSLLGSIRSSAQIVSYEIPLGMSIVGVVLLAGSLNIEQIVQYQAQNGWNVAFQPIAFFIFLVSAFAECNRLPFDLPEAEQELIGGYHTEYSSLKFGLFFLGEYVHMITTSFLFALLFWGGWHFPGVGSADPFVNTLLGVVVLLTKVFGFILLYMLVRWTIPRFRYDQLMALAWQILIPISVANVVLVAFVNQFELSQIITLVGSLVFTVVIFYYTRNIAAVTRVELPAAWRAKLGHMV